MMKLLIKMKKIIFSLIVILSLQNSAQTKDSLNNNGEKINFSNFFNPNYFINELYFNRNFNEINLDDVFLRDSSSILTRTRILLSSFNKDYYISNPNEMLDPLYQNYMKSQNLKFLKQILGTVQLGAVSYLAYLHIKKYGFLKKK